MINIQIINETTYNFKYEKLYKKITKKTLSFLKIKGKSELTIIIVNNEKMKKVSNNYRNINKTTDILSFPADFRGNLALLGYNLFGDIYLSYEKIESQAKDFGHSIKREWCYLFTHGLLHLIGYDHKTEKTNRDMNLISDYLMKYIKVGRNE